MTHSPDVETTVSGDPLTATAIVRDVTSGARSAAEVARQSLEVVAEWEPKVQAFEFLDPALVVAQAQGVDRVAVKGPLAGVTLAVKDVIATKDMPTGHNTARYKGVQTGVDAACVDTLRAAGAIVLGKAVTTEFASTARGGKTRNPHDLTRTPGGSSSGSAAAVACGMAAVGLGTQTGGSTIRPASFNGIFGWKPTWNVISREGLKVYSLTCDTLGLYARDINDFDMLADVFDLDPCDVPQSLEGLRVGFCRTPMWEKAEAPMRAAMDAAALALKSAGAQVIEVELPDIFNGIAEAHGVILAREGRSAFLNEVRNTPDIGVQYRDLVSNARGITPESARAAYALADRCRASFDEIMGGFDVMMTPSSCGEAPEGLESTGDASLNSMWTLLQVPVVSAPGLTGPHGMPLGISFVARRYGDRKAIKVAGLAAPLFEQTGDDLT
ncbi:Glutamyl-tRNA(Gln) amidotransferase subunit A [Aquimixticola soesokkakensis]|uniref:Glutamyl-tRNA(Gln) amidotransferase subunit A n=1 Tax=Aquimixticola soesokkakensis TaxID=1519096 RepID=A0A1Y5TA21_9RHOB|nr:amidase [Aquimixticola soesokkakensis]SLN57295.1 Glutamyl-tRNA(Gln) amidotransferase subunit A [Aquimixticola soesokkakensis]